MAAKGKTLNEFADLHDKGTIVPKRIRTALVQLGDSWEYEGDLIKRAGLSQTDFSRFREQFAADHSVELGGRNPKRAWAGTKAFATKMREKLQ